MATTQELLQRLNTVSPVGVSQPVAPSISIESKSLLDRLNKVSPLPRDLDPDFPGASVIEPVAAVLTGAGSLILEGITRIADARGLLPEDVFGVDIVEAVSGLGAREPKTDAGKQGLKSLAENVKKIVDGFNIPLSAIGGIAELVFDQGPDQALETINSIQNRGVGVTAGERVLEETDDPGLAILARIAPEAILAIAATKTVVTSGRIAKDIFKIQTPTKQRIAKLIEEGSTRKETAGFKLVEPKGLPAPGQPGLPARVEGFIDTGSPTPDISSRLRKTLGLDGPRVIKDKLQIDAVARGFDEGVVAPIARSTPETKTKMLAMVEKMETAINDRLNAVRNRPGDVAGDALLERVKIIKSTNRAAGQELDTVAKNLKGKSVDTSTAIDDFIEGLQEMDIRFGNDLTPRFKGSAIQGLNTDERVIKTIITRLKEAGTPDALATHKMKRFIDRHVTFGKRNEGLDSSTELLLKDLRFNLNEALKNKVPKYDEVNSIYSETIQALNNLQDTAGRKLNFAGPNADKALGVKLRGLMSNNQSRADLLTAIDEIEQVALKHARPGSFNDNLVMLSLFADELDAVFGSVARTSFQGQITQAIGQGTKEAAKGVVRKVVAKGAKKVRESALGTEEERAFRAIRKLLGGDL